MATKGKGAVGVFHPVCVGYLQGLATPLIWGGIEVNSQKGIQCATGALACLVAAGSLGLVTAARMPRPAASHPKINLTLLTFDTGPGILEKPAVAEFMKLHPNIHVSLQSSSSTYYYTKLLTELATGQGPDVFLIGDTDVPTFVDAGVVANLSPLFQHHAFGLNASKYYPNVLNVGKVRGKIYYVPKDWADESVEYNVTMFKKAHLPLPKAGWTWAQFIQDAKKLTVVKNGKTVQYGAQLPGTWLRAGLEEFEAVFGGHVLSPNGKTASGYLNSPTSIRAITYYLNMYRQDHISPTPTQMAGYAHVDLFETGRVAMEPTGPWSLSTYQKVPHFQFGVAPMPRLTPKSKPATTVFWSGWAVNKRSPHLKAAEELAAFFASPWWQYKDKAFAMDAEKGPWIAQSVKTLPQLKVYFKQEPNIAPLEPTKTQNWTKDVSPALTNMIEAAILKPHSNIASLVRTATNQIDAALKSTYGG